MSNFWSTTCEGWNVLFYGYLHTFVANDVPSGRRVEGRGEIQNT